jgi:hypothetical protein
LGEIKEHTTWFFQFLLTEYDDDKWVENFKMTKKTLFKITNQLQGVLLK